jgi:hypothetical protein
MNIVLGDSYKVKDYVDMTRMNEDYWVFSTQNMSYLDLFKQYINEIYVVFESFLSSRPTFVPLLCKSWWQQMMGCIDYQLV